MNTVWMPRSVEGRLLMAEARAMSDRWTGLSDRLSVRRSRPEGTPRMIGPSGYGTGFSTDAVSDLRAAWPQVRVEMMLTDRVLDLASTGAECWMCVGAVRDPGLVLRHLGDMERILVANPGLLRRIGRVTPATLPSMPCVGLVPCFVNTVRLLDKSERSQMVSIDTPLRTASLLASYRAVLNGEGIGAAAPWMCQADLEAGRLKRVLPHLVLEPVGIYVALPPGLNRLARVTAFIEALRHRIGGMQGFRRSIARNEERVIR